MKVVCISDTHLYHEDSGCRQPVVPDGDLLVHAGDGTFDGSVREIRSWLDWLAGFPHPNKVFIAGNHDWLFQKDPALARSLIPPGLTYLQDEMKEVAGLKIYGTPWTPFFMNWAFNVPRGPGLVAKYSKIPPHLDILISHGPPFKVLDRTPDGDAVGSAELRKVVDSRPPRLHVFGHIHHGHGVMTLGGPGPVFVNASMVDEGYANTANPIVVEL